MYYARHFDAFSLVVNALDPDEASCIRKVKDLLSNVSLKGNLAFIEAHFSGILRSIEKLEEKGMALVDSLKIFEEALKSFESTPGSKGSRIRRKCESVVARNPDFSDLCKIAAVLDGSSMESDLP